MQKFNLVTYMKYWQIINYYCLQYGNLDMLNI